MRHASIVLVFVVLAHARAPRVASFEAADAGCPFEDGTGIWLDSSLNKDSDASHSFRVLHALILASRTRCPERAFYYTTARGQTLFAPTDEAFEKLFINLGRGLDEILADARLLCGIVSYHLTIPCCATNDALWRRSCGFLLTKDIIDGQPLETLFRDDALSAGLDLSGIGTASSLLFVAASQDAGSTRKLRVDGYLKRGADVIGPNVVMCSGLGFGPGLAVHVIDDVLVPAAAFYSSVESVIESYPELSITAEAFFLTRALRESFLTTPFAQVQGTSDVTAQQFPGAVIVPPLIPRGTLPSPVLPEPGMCTPGEVIDGTATRTVFAATNLAWKNFFRRVGLSKEQVFSDPELLLSTLQYSEVISAVGLSPIGADGILAGSRYFTWNMYPLEILQSSVQPELLFVTPLLGPSIGALNFFDLVMDITCVGNKRIVTVDGQRYAVLGRNQAVVVAPDLVACDGLVHVVDSVLITTGLTTLRQLSLRPELSLFTEIVTSPGNELLALDLDQVGNLGQIVSGIAIFAPTNAAVEGTLAYLVGEKSFLNATTSTTRFDFFDRRDTPRTTF